MPAAQTEGHYTAAAAAAADVVVVVGAADVVAGACGDHAPFQPRAAGPDVLAAAAAAADGVASGRRRVPGYPATCS